jgi:hypothetical protein
MRRFFITPAPTGGNVMDRSTLAVQLRQSATEVIGEEAAGKIDWAKWLNLLMQILPLILPLFAKKEEVK